MLPSPLINGLVQIAFICSLASAVNTGPDGAEQSGVSGNASIKPHPKFTDFNKFLVELSYGKKFTGGESETPITPKGPSDSPSSKLPEVPESPKAPVDQIQMENDKIWKNSSSSTPPPLVTGEVALEPEDQTEIDRPEDELKTENSTNTEQADSELKQMNESSDKGLAIGETLAGNAVGTLSPQNATCPDIDIVLAELNLEAPASGTDVAGKEVPFNTFSAETASKYASCADIEDALAQFYHPEPKEPKEPKADTDDLVKDTQGQKMVPMTENKRILPQAETKSGLAQAGVLGDVTVLDKPASGNAKESFVGHVNLSASARINANKEVSSSELAKVPKAPIVNSEPAEGKHVSAFSPQSSNDSSSRSNQEVDDMVIHGDRVPEETSTLTTTSTKYVYAPDTSTFWNTRTSTVCDENSPCATAPAEETQGSKNEAIVDSAEPVKLSQATEIPHFSLSVQKDEESKAKEEKSPDQTTASTFTITITSTVRSRPFPTFKSTIVSTTCSNSTSSASLKTIRPMGSLVSALKPVVAYEGKASSLTFGGAIMGALGVVCVFV